MEKKNYMISVIGPKASGKSHYISVLIQSALKSRFPREFGASARFLSDLTKDTYNSVLHDPVYFMHRTIPPTRAKANNDDLIPLIYNLSISGETITFVFFDTAGEDLKRQDTIMAYNRYIGLSDGLVFLVDPLQFPRVNERLQYPNKPPKVGNQVTDVYESVINSIRTIGQIKSSKKIDSPIAIAFTKADLLLRDPYPGEDRDVLLGKDSSVLVERRKGGYDQENFDQVSNEVENYIDYVTEGHMNTLTKNNFKRYKYFAMSALGSDPKNGVIDNLSPMRIEDPVIWLLYEFGIIKKLKR